MVNTNLVAEKFRLKTFDIKNGAHVIFDPFLERTDLLFDRKAAGTGRRKHGVVFPRPSGVSLIVQSQVK